MLVNLQSNNKTHIKQIQTAYSLTCTSYTKEVLTFRAAKQRKGLPLQCTNLQLECHQPSIKSLSSAMTLTEPKQNVKAWIWFPVSYFFRCWIQGTLPWKNMRFLFLLGPNEVEEAG